MNVYPVYEANVMYEYKLVTKVGTTLAPHWLGASDGNTRRWYTACQHWHRSQLRGAVGAVISPGSAENIVNHHSRERRKLVQSVVIVVVSLTLAPRHATLL